MHTVIASYEGFDEAKEQQAETIAAKHGAKLNGSGYGFGQRDMDWDVPTQKAGQAMLQDLWHAGFAATLKERHRG